MANLLLCAYKKETLSVSFSFRVHVLTLISKTQIVSPLAQIHHRQHLQRAQAKVVFKMFSHCFIPLSFNFQDDINQLTTSCETFLIS